MRITPNSTGPASKRFDLGDCGSGSRPGSQADWRYKVWSDQLDQLPLGEAAKTQAKDFLKGLAQGHAQNHTRAQAVFNALIEHEAYELFVEAFSVHQDLELKQAEADHQPYTSTLCLQLHDGWTPRAPAFMVAALAQVRVDRLEVLRAPMSQTPTQGDAPAQTPVCEALCNAFYHMLQSGTRELCLQAALANAGAVGEAIRESRSLESLSLGRPQALGPMDAQEQADCRRILSQGALESSSLRRLALHGREPVGMLALFLATRQTSPLPWTSLTLGCCNDGGDVNPLLADLPRLFQRLPDLSVFEFATTGLDAATRVRTLAIFREASTVGSLRRFVWDLGPLNNSTTEARQELQDVHPHLFNLQAEFVRETFRQSTFQLEDLVISGYPWSLEGLAALRDEVTMNKTLKRVDVDGTSITAATPTTPTTTTATATTTTTAPADAGTADA